MNQKKKKLEKNQNQNKHSIISGVETDDANIPTPTLRQLFLAMRQIQHDLTDIKSQLNQERSMRGNLQQMLMNHLESTGSSCGVTDMC